MNRFQNEEPIILSGEVVYDILDELYTMSFGGLVAFHVYNEPLLDPRLFSFMGHGGFRYLILTNGSYLTQDIANELVYLKTAKIIVSAYSDKEVERLNKITVNIPYEVVKRKMDDRLNIYTAPEVNSNRLCFAPLNEIIIRCDGSVGLCCLDWKKTAVFGNVYDDTLEDILESGAMQKVYEELSHGKRNPDICKRCKTSR